MAPPKSEEEFVATSSEPDILSFADFRNLQRYDYQNCAPVCSTLPIETAKQLRGLVLIVARGLVSQKSSSYTKKDAWVYLIRNRQRLLTRECHDALARVYLSAREKLGRQNSISKILFECLNVHGAAVHNKPEIMLQVMSSKDKESLLVYGGCKDRFLEQDYGRSHKLLLEYFNNGGGGMRAYWLKLWIGLIILVGLNVWLYCYRNSLL